MALLGGQTEPAHSFGLVLEDTLAGGVHEPEAVLRIGLALLGGQTEPARRFGLVLENAPPGGVHETEAELGFGVTLLSVNEEPSHRCGIVATGIRCHSFVKRLPRRDWRAGQRSQQRQGDNATPNQPVFNACL